MAKKRRKAVYIRSSCERCVKSKRACDGATPSCARCLAAGSACRYGLTKKVPTSRRTPEGDPFATATAVEDQRAAGVSHRAAAGAAAAGEAVAIERVRYSASAAVGLTGAEKAYLSAYVACFGGSLFPAAVPAAIIDAFLAAARLPAALVTTMDRASLLAEAYACAAVALGAVLGGDCADPSQHVYWMLLANLRLQQLLTAAPRDPDGASSWTLDQDALNMGISRIHFLEALYYLCTGRRDLFEECLILAGQALEEVAASNLGAKDDRLMLAVIMSSFFVIAMQLRGGPITRRTPAAAAIGTDSTLHAATAASDDAVRWKATDGAAPKIASHIDLAVRRGGAASGKPLGLWTTLYLLNDGFVSNFLHGSGGLHTGERRGAPRRGALGRQHSSRVAAPCDELTTAESDDPEAWEEDCGGFAPAMAWRSSPLFSTAVAEQLASLAAWCAGRALQDSDAGLLLPVMWLAAGYTVMALQPWSLERAHWIGKAWARTMRMARKFPGLHAVNPNTGLIGALICRGAKGSASAEDWAAFRCSWGVCERNCGGAVWPAVAPSELNPALHRGNAASQSAMERAVPVWWAWSDHGAV